MARAARAQWTDEVAARGLLDPLPIRVRWGEPSARWVSDYADVINAQMTCRTDDLQSLVDAFCSLPRQRLIILGGPGGGKTTLAVLLMYSLLNKSKVVTPVPIFVSLASWDPTRDSLLEWLEKQLSIDYAALNDVETYGPSVIHQLIKDRAILPFLDGLDEIPQKLRPAAVRAINSTLTSEQPFVLTCRSIEYSEAVRLSDVITAAAVIEAQPVEPDAAVNYLRQGTSPHQASKWNTVFDRVKREPDGAIAVTFRTPLMVWLARVVYARHERNPEELLAYAEASSVENRLLGQFLPSIFENRFLLKKVAARSWSAKRAQKSLTFLAAHLQNTNTVDLAWWRLDEIIRKGFLSRFIVAALFGITCGIFAGLRFGIFLGIACGIGPLAAGAVASFQDSSNPSRASFRVSGRFAALMRNISIRTATAVGTLLGVTIVLSLFGQVFVAFISVLGVGLALLTGHVSRTMVFTWRFDALLLSLGLFLALTIPVGFGLLAGSIGWVVTPVASEQATDPKSTVAADRRVFLFGCTIGPIIGIGLAVLIVRGMDLIARYFMRLTLVHGLIAPMELGVLVGFVVSLFVTFPTCGWPRFIVTLAVLGGVGRVTPQLIVFLGDAHRLGILRRVGAVYQFRHMRLQQYLAQAHVAVGEHRVES